MKVLFIGDYSNVHACLAEELRRLGHHVTVVSDGGKYQQTAADRKLVRRQGLFGSFRYLYDVMALLPELAGYDVVQLINPHFLNLRPGKLNYFFRKIKDQNGSMWMTLAGNDYYFVKAAREGKIFRYSEFRVGSERTPMVKQDPETEYGWLTRDAQALNEVIYYALSGAMAVIPEYYMAAEPILGNRCHFTNLPLDLRSHPFTEMPDFSDGVKIAVGMKDEMAVRKGTGIILKAARQLAEELPGMVTIEKVSGLAYKDYLLKIQESHIILDQLYAYSPATNALDAMALGRVAASGGEPEFYDFIGEQSLRPIIPLSPINQDIKNTLRQFVENPELLIKMGKEGRELAEKYNDVRIVAPKFVELWEK